jgi:hypothetical protein
MQVLSYAVNSFFPTLPLPQQPQVLVFVNQFLGEANYSKRFARSQGAHKKMCARTGIPIQTPKPGQESWQASLLPSYQKVTANVLS